MENEVEPNPKSILTLEKDKVSVENGVNSNGVDLFCATQMQLELDKLRRELRDKNAECQRLQDSHIKVEAEIEDLTASLFEEANKMVYDANVKRHRAEKQLAEAKGNIDALQTEVDALKSLVLTSTPSNPNRLSHPQLIEKKENKLMSPLRRHKRNSSLVETEKVRETDTSSCSTSIHEFAIADDQTAVNVTNMNKEIDRCLFNEIEKWHRELHNSPKKSTPDGRCNCSRGIEDTDGKTLSDCLAITQSSFMSRVYQEDIALCLMFQNDSLSQNVSKCIHNNSLSVELISNPVVLQKCQLSGLVTQCRHRLRLDESDQYFPISQSCRNRLTTVCDFLTYIRYVRQGLVKQTVEQIYWEIIRLRMEMTFARLGFFREQT
uniref:Guanine nucleotide exchange factor for Rab-3A n=1 Tax=Phallusia mammillata TaxID=59560 RepID=A0A6F9DQX7_9ASCI|nr:guanine nucleotide exchange factor for Rab-3A [Phallusia mammillata]